MTLTIIAGTHTFVDLTGNFKAVWVRSMQRRMIHDYDGIKFSKSRFDRIEILKDGSIIRHPRLINPIDSKGYRWTVNQPTGSCKSILGVYNLARTWARGGNIAANLSFEYMPHNIGKPREQWTPNLTSIEDITKANNVRLLIDDIKGTAENWQAEESELISMAANLSRKDRVDIDITTQGVTNFVAPNIRRVTTGYEIPYCTIRDQRLPSPDGRGYPRLIEVISLIPGDMQIGDIFVGFGCLNNDIPDGRQITPSQALLNSYKSMEIATGLKTKGNEGSRPNQPGYALEVKALEYLISKVPSMKWKHLNGKNVFDIVSDLWAVDVTDTDDDGKPYTQSKDLTQHIRTAKKKGQKPYIMFPYKGTWGFVPITYHTNDRCAGKKIDIDSTTIRTIDSLLK